MFFLPLLRKANKLNPLHRFARSKPNRKDEINLVDHQKFCSFDAPRLNYHAKHGGLWTDLNTAHLRLAGKIQGSMVSEQLAEDLRHWIDHGYVIFRKEVADEVINGILAELQLLNEGNPRDLVGTYWNKKGEQIRQRITSETDLREKEFKILDMHALESCQKALFTRRALEFMTTVFERPPMGFQSLTFKYGSQQPVHQDCAFVKVDSPLEFAASWIALEDIEVNAGRLQFYPGSHRLDHRFEGDHKWAQLQVPGMSFDQYPKDLHELAQNAGLEIQEFDAKKGDVLIWSSNLIHGGSELCDKDSTTRRSLVTHFCPVDCTPWYFYQHPVIREEVVQKAAFVCYPKP